MLGLGLWYSQHTCIMPSVLYIYKVYMYYSTEFKEMCTALYSITATSCQNPRLASHRPVRGADAGDHEGPAVPPEGVLQEAGQLGVTVGNVRGLLGYVPQGTDDVAQGKLGEGRGGERAYMYVQSPSFNIPNSGIFLWVKTFVNCWCGSLRPSIFTCPLIVTHPCIQ